MTSRALAAIAEILAREPLHDPVRIEMDRLVRSAWFEHADTELSEPYTSRSPEEIVCRGGRIVLR